MAECKLQHLSANKVSANSLGQRYLAERLPPKDFPYKISALYIKKLLKYSSFNCIYKNQHVSVNLVSRLKVEQSYAKIVSRTLQFLF